MEHSDTDLRHSGERIERLLEEVRAMAGKPAWQRVDELLRLVVELYGSGLSRIVELLHFDGTVEELRERLLADKLVASLLLLHGLHPQDVATRVSDALEKVRPYLGSHGGEVELLGIDEETGVVKLRLGGSCDGCPSSMVTVKLAVEGAIKELAPEITRVEVEGLADASETPQSIESLLAKTHATGSGPSSKLPSWQSFDNTAPQNSGDLLMAEVAGESIMLCRVGKQLYAYRGKCPSCGSIIETAVLHDEVLTCASCDTSYNVHFAGRSTGGNGLHLEPIPLIENEAGVKIALPGAAL
jgi:Fe-S cluster biogenesis protein NfuA/nitrite reductase/ring-hydroxylating ferredoxin subunit